MAQDSAPYAGQVFAVSTSETATAADAAECIFVFPCFVDETVTAQDTITTQTVFPAAIAVAAAALDAAPSTAVTFPVSVSENLAATVSAATTSVVFQALIAEGMTAADALSAAFLWNDIDDTQIPGWTDILRPTTIDTVATFGSQNFAAHSFAGGRVQEYNPNPAVWNEIDDSQDPGWTVIDAV